MSPRINRRRLALLAAAVLGSCVAACGGDDGAASPATSGTSTGLTGSVDLGCLPNVTHATARLGVAEGFFAHRLGDCVTFKTFTCTAGPEASEALLSGAIDLTFIGPNPAINAFAKSKGEAIRIVSGSTSGGAFLVVKPDITSVE